MSYKNCFRPSNSITGMRAWATSMSIIYTGRGDKQICPCWVVQDCDHVNTQCNSSCRIFPSSMHVEDVAHVQQDSPTPRLPSLWQCVIQNPFCPAWSSFMHMCLHCIRAGLGEWSTIYLHRWRRLKIRSIVGMLIWPCRLGLMAADRDQEVVTEFEWRRVCIEEHVYTAYIWVELVEERAQNLDMVNNRFSTDTRKKNAWLQK
ncbi:uncharacterized protein [Triticum aestivum]|uniref:uncharacterized protein n=1 Tax=Triticum aestivum TaxID=4565 RepID=UPI001D01952E|nr:uncharacterized protein LOC123065323 [Triticum aestivum]